MTNNASFASAPLALLIVSLALTNSTKARATSPRECSSQTKVVLDAGHTPEQPGATSARGEPEYLFNLGLAQRTAQELKAGGYQVVLPSIHGAGQEQLANRIARARNEVANLLLSIHHDSVQPIFLHRWTFDGKINHYSDDFSGFSIFVADSSEHYEKSFVFAQHLADEMMKAGLKPSLHHAMSVPGEGRKLLDGKRGIYANSGLAILRGASSPAALLEAGIIVNRADELNLQKFEVRSEISRAIVEAIGRTFCNPH